MSDLFVPFVRVSIRALVSLKVVDRRTIRSLAFDRLQSRLFQIPEVQALAVQGFAGLNGSAPASRQFEVTVLTTCEPTPILIDDIGRIVSDINELYTADLKAHVKPREVSICASGS
ncbi:MAG TPA: hypothetical protein VMH23_01805 [Bacteroidota bacterium]|nr:hypothetical protein [Bacteroidota bacterium]